MLVGFSGGVHTGKCHARFSAHLAARDLSAAASELLSILGSCFGRI